RDVVKKMSATVSGREFDAWWSKLTTAQRQAAKAGTVADALKKASNGRQRLKELLTQNYGGKLTTMFGVGNNIRAGAKQLTQMLRDRADMVRDAQRMIPGVGSDTSETLLSSAEEDKAIAEGLRAVRHIREGRPVTAALNALLSPVVGLRRGYQADMDQATRDAMGRLLMMKPSALAAALERHNATPHETTNLLEWYDRAKRSTAYGLGSLAKGEATRAYPDAKEQAPAE
ncbi:MAG: hypothetical protein KGL39_40555, partial [Patescibacteria group bacterium]|nr:hypothetical protein [Patescibacteria group bacterium]